MTLAQQPATSATPTVPSAPLTAYLVVWAAPFTCPPPPPILSNEHRQVARRPHARRHSHQPGVEVLFNPRSRGVGLHTAEDRRNMKGQEDLLCMGMGMGSVP